MQPTSITAIIHAFIPISEIQSLKITLNKHNHQVETITIQQPENTNFNYLASGQIADALDTYTMGDGYGDITALTITHDSQWTEDGTELLPTITFTFDIDS